MSKPEITYKLDVEQDDLQVRGNASVSGDEEFDKQVEDEIQDRLQRGDVWAWACVTVIAECQGYKGRAVLGCCNYEDEEDFKKDGYFNDLKIEAREDLLKNLENSVLRGKEAAMLLQDLLGDESVECPHGGECSKKCGGCQEAGDTGER